MREILLLACSLSLAAFALFLNSQPAKPIPLPFSHAVSSDLGTLDPEFQQFMATIDRDLLLAYIDEFNVTGQTNLDALEKCADFNRYAQYMRISKLEAIKKFEHVLRHTDTLIEFEHRLAR